MFLKIASDFPKVDLALKVGPSEFGIFVVHENVILDYLKTIRLVMDPVTVSN